LGILSTEHGRQTVARVRQCAVNRDEKQRLADGRRDESWDKCRVSALRRLHSLTLESERDSKLLNILITLINSFV